MFGCVHYQHHLRRQRRITTHHVSICCHVGSMMSLAGFITPMQPYTVQSLHEDKKSELMGLYLFSGLVFSWFPPLLFQFLNEIGASMRICLASLNLFFVGGFIFLKMMGDYQDAVDFALSRGDGDDESRESLDCLFQS